MRLCLPFLGVAIAASASGPAWADPALDQLKAYGEHLSQECVVCHRTDGGPDKGVASIVGWSRATFVATLKAYRNQEFAERRNPVMVSVTRSLSDEEVEALAVYFESLKPPR